MIMLDGITVLEEDRNIMINKQHKVSSNFRPAVFVFVAAEFVVLATAAGAA